MELVLGECRYLAANSILLDKFLFRAIVVQWKVGQPGPGLVLLLGHTVAALFRRPYDL